MRCIAVRDYITASRRYAMQYIARIAALAGFSGFTDRVVSDMYLNSPLVLVTVRVRGVASE